MGIKTYDEAVDKIKDYAKNKGITMAEISRKAGIPKSTLSLYWSKKREMTSSSFIKICNAIEFNPFK